MTHDSNHGYILCVFVFNCLFVFIYLFLHVLYIAIIAYLPAYYVG